MTLFLVWQRSNEKKMSKHSSFHIFPNLCYCPDWPPFTVSGPSKHLSKASPPPGHQTSAFLPVVASFSPASLMFPVYSSTGYFPSAYKHAMSFHIGKKKEKNLFWHIPLPAASPFLRSYLWKNQLSKLSLASPPTSLLLLSLEVTLIIFCCTGLSQD